MAKPFRTPLRDRLRRVGWFLLNALGAIVVGLLIAAMVLATVLSTMEMRDDCYKRCAKWYCDIAKTPWCP